MTKSSKLAEISFLGQLEETVRDRMQQGETELSYVASLMAEGDRRIAQKLGEEAVETVLAAVGGTRTELIEEAADLLFHLLVLLQAKDIQLADVVRELEQRHRVR